MAISPKIYTFGCGCFAALGASIFGYDLSVISSVFTAPDFIELTDIASNPTYQGFIVSSMLLGAFVGSIPASLVADLFSRRTSLTCAGVIFLLGGALQTGAQSRGMMLAGRFFAGFAIGGLGTLVPLYQSEIAHPSQRGRIMATFQFFLGLGSFIATWIAYACAKYQYGTALQWRLPIGRQMLPAVPLVFLTFLLPESPRWLMLKHRDAEAIKVLAKLHARGNESDSFVQAEYASMKRQVEEEAGVDTTWKALYSSVLNLRKVLLGVILQFSVQMTGVGVIQYYSVSIYTSVGYKGSQTLLIQAINNLFGLLAEVACILFLDKTGRRGPLIWCNVIGGICFAAATPLVRKFTFGTGTKADGLGFLAVTFLFNIVFSYGIGPLSWVYPTEIMNTGIRAKGSALTAMASWIANFMMGEIAPTAFAQVSWRFYIVFCVCCFTNALVIYLLFPETKNRTLEEMDDYFRRGNWVVIRDKDMLRSAEDPERRFTSDDSAPAVLPVADDDKHASGHLEIA
ncbi:hypothetical protein I203_102080 [Kwoniella mangroviensis CBS 8507]|uniref:uncharacterized protein n=1 Tax=Kwoniella mangroviensis CBS 8507 TaxID=1296122 RepID=UPI00080CDBA0|nr:uncharacterized protein I203_03275 [Kwoniella mangroviensis CBS 8507]OCF67578.1 hypothetical protein I203_03275 [Kwoniella mangroviensis CBS 8507]